MPEQTSDEPDHDWKLGKVVAETGAGKHWEGSMCHGADIAIERHRDSHDSGAEDDGKDGFSPFLSVSACSTEEGGNGVRYQVSPRARMVLPVSQLCMLMTSLAQ